jgi:AraC family ethanolamine operon transcriptional activator
MLVSNGSFYCAVEQQGETPTGMRTIAIQADGCAPIRWFGKKPDESTLMVFPKNSELSSFSQPEFHIVTISVPNEMLEGFIEGQVGESSDKILGPEEHLFRTDRRALSRLISSTNQITGMRHEPNERLRDQAISDYRELVLESILGAAIGNDGEVNRHLNKQRQSTLTKAMTYIDAMENEPISMTDLSKATGVTTRALQILFKQQFGMSPKQYMLRKRLLEVRRQLMKTRPGPRLVTDIANACGFWHMGQFAADYRKMFGELPSETLDRKR